MISHYLRLQLKRSYRAIRAFGIHPMVAYPLILVLFIGISQLLFHKIANAKFLIVLVALITIRASVNPQRDDFLKNSYNLQQFRKIKLLETSLLLLPFILVLLFKGFYMLALLLIPKAILVSFFPGGKNQGRTIPTPFSKKPFEFSRGFRKNLPGIVLAIFICSMGIIYKNQNLSFFALILTLFFCINFYSELELPYFIWIHNIRPEKFLKMKIKTALQQAVLLITPVLLLLLIFYTKEWLAIVVIVCWGLLFQALLIITKYARTPETMNLADAIFLGACLLFPPLMLFFIPLYYKKSTHQLEVLLK